MNVNGARPPGEIRAAIGYDDLRVQIISACDSKTQTHLINTPLLYRKAPQEGAEVSCATFLFLAGVLCANQKLFL
jgi:hypothetical protein